MSHDNSSIEKSYERRLLLVQRTAKLSEMDDPCDRNYCGVLIHVCLIIYEAIDKLVDGLVLTSYSKGNLSDNPQDSVGKALSVFLISGLLFSFLLIGLYCGRIVLYRANDNSLDESPIPIYLLMSFAKVWLEAFPQATIALFYFDNCATKKKDKSLVQAFDVFSMSPFIMFVFFTFHYYCTHEEAPRRIMTFVLAVTFMLSIVGIIFAGLSMTAFDQFNDSC